MGEKFLSLRFLATALLTLGLLIIGGFNIDQKRSYVIPDDGCVWIQTARGVQAQVVLPESACDRAGVHEGDFLRWINNKKIESDADVIRALYGVGVYSTAKYDLERNGERFEAPVPIYPPVQRLVRRRLYLEIIGIYSLLVGALVLIKRFGAPTVMHFYYVCLISFVLFAYSYTGKLDALDWTVFWLDTAANVFLPPLFLHFCLEFPKRNLSGGQRGLLVLLYVPGALLLATWAAFVYGILVLTFPLQLRRILETTGDFHFGVYFVASAILLFRTYRTVRTPDLRQQMKWVTRGVALGALPYFLLQSLPRAAGFIPEAWIDVAVFPLALIPTSFGYAISRYKLADADVIFKRGVTYTLATASVVTMIILAGQVLGTGLEWPVGTVARVGATIVAALLFSPIKDQFQVWLDKIFYGERYSVRRTLVDFARTLGAEVRSENLLDRIVDRLSRAFSVEHAAVFVESVNAPEVFLPALVRGVDMPVDPQLSFLKPSAEQRYLFFEEAVLGFNYFIPCRVKNRVIAYIAIGQTQKGDYLNSEDLELLEAMSDYVGIALENSRLYKSLEQRAYEYHDLKDFNENIIESINVGVVVEDVNGRVAGWNKALENMTGINRDATLGKSIDEAIPEDFLRRLAEHRHLYKQQWNGLTVNLSLTSLLDKTGAARGRLIIIDDITDRIRLEDQLIQNEKLTSIGLLAAGVAHEVNTPLAVISSYSQMLRKQIATGDARYKLLEKITAQTFRASEIVNNLLSFSRMNAAEFASIDIHKVINETLSLLEHPLKTSQIGVSANLLAEAPLVTGNSGKLQQVFLNLFLNARDAMPDGGVLGVRTAIVDGRIEIVVTDSGAGISREHIKKIYDPFFTTKTAGKGTGLGLSVSYGIVQEHGGNISVESSVGRGTSFRLDFPLSRKVVNV